MKTGLPNPRRRAGVEGRDGASYIVRVYRWRAERIVGVVEMPLQGRRRSFRSFAELRAILAAGGEIDSSGTALGAVRKTRARGAE